MTKGKFFDELGEQLCMRSGWEVGCLVWGRCSFQLCVTVLAELSGLFCCAVLAKGPRSRGGGGKLLSLKPIFIISKWVVSNINHLLLTKSNARPGKLPSAETSCAHADSDRRRSRARVSPVKSRQGRSGQALALEQCGRGSSSLPFGGTK